MRSAVRALEDYLSHFTHQPLRVGVICILHPFGKDMKFYPHLHLLITEGGFNRRGRFIRCKYVPARKFAKTWQYHVLTDLKQAGVAGNIIDFLFKKYDGFYVWVHARGRIRSPRLIAKYVGRYVRHPAIANSRILSYDGKTVLFYYKDHEDIQHNVRMDADDFITALIQHIPEPNFKMVRWYGAYAPRTKGKFKVFMQSDKYQMTLLKFGAELPNPCPICRNSLKFIGYCPGKPPPYIMKKVVALDWIDVRLEWDL